MCIESETLCAIIGSNAAQVVLIGDHKQLQPVIKDDKAKELGLGISMFERYSEKAQMLKRQYRMVRNRNFYLVVYQFYSSCILFIYLFIL